MKLPEIQETNRYVGLYVADFGDHSSVGFTAEEVSELLESEQFADAQIYKIHNALPDGTIEIKGVHRETFQLEAGMFFYAADEPTARDDFARLVTLFNEQPTPARAKIHLAKTDEAFVTALIYPAEFDDAFSRLLLDRQYRTTGAVEGGACAMQRYYDADWPILQRQQLWPASSLEQLQGEQLIEATKRALVR